MEIENDLQPATPAASRMARSRGGLRAGLAGLAVAALLTVGAVSVFAAEAEKTPAADSSATPTLPEPGEAVGHRDCPDEPE